MNFKQTTQVPNLLFDNYLPVLTGAELKLLLVIIRQTYGWVDKRTGHRKHKDRLCMRQFEAKTGLCKRVITKSIQTLVTRGLINVYDPAGNSLDSPSKRKG